MQWLIGIDLDRHLLRSTAFGACLLLLLMLMLWIHHPSVLKCRYHVCCGKGYQMVADRMSECYVV